MATNRSHLPRNRAADVSRTIQQSIEHSIRYHQTHKSQIAGRLQELDEEWDIERALQAIASAVSLFGVARGLLGRSRWFVVSATASGFLLQHALQGWCPPIAPLRRLGYRTAFEIDQERQALKLLRGDYRKTAAGDADDILEAVRA